MSFKDFSKKHGDPVDIDTLSPAVEGEVPFGPPRPPERETKTETCAEPAPKP